MNLIRPELRKMIWRFREAILGAAVCGLGFYWAMFGLGLMNFIGVIVGLFGGVLLVTGVQRGLFRVGRDGAGVVQINEGQIIYFGPAEGGAIAMSDLVRVDLTRGPGTGRHWRLQDQFGAVLSIPIDAEGAEALFDVLSNLGGVRASQLVSALHDDLPDRFVIWQSNDNRLH